MTYAGRQGAVGASPPGGWFGSAVSLMGHTVLSGPSQTYNLVKEPVTRKIGRRHLAVGQRASCCWSRAAVYK